jgi:hypothetical protein
MVICFSPSSLRVKSHDALGKYMALRNITRNHTMVLFEQGESTVIGM